MKKVFSIIFVSALLALAMPVRTWGQETKEKSTLADTLVLKSAVVSTSSSVARLRQVQAGVENIEITQLSKMPSLLGERDIIRSLQLLPGVKAAGEGSSGFQVRGGTTSQNLILLDVAPVWNAGHLMGLFSTFNDEALANATLYKGLIPASFGGATSSVFDVMTRPGDMQEYHGSAGIGLLSAKVALEGPIAEDKASFFISGRRTYFDLFLKLTEDYKSTILNFDDLNGRIDWKLSSKDRMSLSAFHSRDKIALKEYGNMTWYTTTGDLHWSHVYGDSFRQDINAYVSSYDSDNEAAILEQSIEYTSYIRYLGLKAKWLWNTGDRNTVDFGVQPVLMKVKTGEWEYNFFPESEKRDAFDLSFWMGDEWKVSDKLAFSAGLRVNAFSPLGGQPYYNLDEEGNILDVLEYSSGEIVKTHWTVEPRFSANWQMTENMSIKAGYTRSEQNLHALKNDGLSFPFDRFMMSSNLIEPETSDQVSLGWFGMTPSTDYDFSVEGYYKAIDGVLDYMDGKWLASEIEMERLVKAGKGKAYGTEFIARKNNGRFTGWVSYTLSWSKNQIEGINQGRWYTAANDRRHDFTIVGMYDFGKGWQGSASWKYTSGQALTAPSAKYEIEGSTYYYYAEKNGYRAPANHHLDLSLSNSKQKKGYEREWVFGIYNVYDRRNPFVITYMSDDTKPSGTKTIMTSLFGLVPSISFNIKF